MIALLAPAVASATYTSTVTGGDATMIDEGGPTNLTIFRSGANLAHNPVGGAFENGLDFDTEQPGVQTISNAAATDVDITGAPGGTTFQEFQLGDAANAASETLASTSILKDGGFARLFVENGADTTGRTVTPQAGGIVGLGGGAIDYTGIGSILITLGSGNDVLNVNQDPEAQVIVSTSAGDDRVALSEASGFPSIAPSLGPGTDTLDYSAYTTPVDVGPPTRATFAANLNGAQEVPSTASGATGTATMALDLESNTLLSFNADVQGITTDGSAGTNTLTDSHIHEGAPGVNGPARVQLGGPGQWTNDGSGGMTRGLSGLQVLSDSFVDQVLAGNSYVNIHTNVFPDGEIRGQLQGDEFSTDEATGMAFAGGFENVIGGSGNDTLNGNPLANQLTGGPGADSLFGAAGNDILNASDGVADTELACGDGTDVLNRDPAATDPDSTVSGCETDSSAAPADSDGDGVPDASDACPNQAAGTANGCPAAGGGGGTTPAADSDGDGVPDASDACPSQAAPTANGCPATAPPKPSNVIELGKPKRNTKSGSAKQPVEVPGPGTLELAGKGIKSVEKIVSGAGSVNLRVKPTGKLADKLDDAGKAKVTIEVTFTPAGGDPNSESKKVTLKEE